MGFWSGIKHALNSTLGTEDFKPLDRLMYEGKALQPSDELYYYLYNYAAVQAGEVFKLPLSLAFKTFGTINISCSSISRANRRVVIYKNGDWITTLHFNAPYETTTETLQTAISVSPNDVISFEYAVDSGSHIAYFSDLQINAKVVDTSVISLKEE